MNRSAPTRPLRWLGAALLCLGLPAQSLAEPAPSAHHESGELLLFPAVTGFYRSRPVPGLSRNKVRPEIQVFYSTDWGRLRFLAEALASSEESEVERFQLGWLLPSGASLWLGRFHTPLGAWNAEHHHGAYLQTSISRPAIIEYEDFAGVLPTHVTGLLFEGTAARGEGLVSYMVSAGRGPTLEEDELRPVEIHHPGRGGSRTLSAQLGYRPQADQGWEAGVVLSASRIPVRGQPGWDEAALRLAGAYVRWDAGRWRLVGELFRVAHRPAGPAAPGRGAFTAAYLQPEYRLGADWTAFGRLEGRGGWRDDAYLDLFPDALAGRAVAGLRLGVGANQAVKFELSRGERHDRLRFNELAVQWSMAFP